MVNKKTGNVMRESVIFSSETLTLIPLFFYICKQLSNHSFKNGNSIQQPFILCGANQGNKKTLII